MQLFIDEDYPTDLGIKVIPKENNRITTSYIKIQEIQTIDIDVPDGYGKPIIVPSSEYQKMCKDMSHIGNIINIVAKNFHIKFRCNAGGIMKRNVEFGELGDDSDDEETNDIEYNQHFETEQLSRITKIAGLSTNIQIFTKKDKPLLFKSSIGSLGKISIFIKSKDIIENENKCIESDTED